MNTEPMMTEPTSVERPETLAVLANQLESRLIELDELIEQARDSFARYDGAYHGTPSMKQNEKEAEMPSLKERLKRAHRRFYDSLENLRELATRLNEEL